MSKEVKYAESVRRELFNGVEKLATAVTTTLGPKGRNVLIERGFGSPVMTKDGVTVAKEIRFEHQYQNLGAQVVKEAAIRTNEKAGDGTTTATALAYSIIKDGLKYVESGHDPIELKRGIMEAQKAAIEALKPHVKEIEDVDDILHVASISANNDFETGKFIAEAFNHIGKDGVVTVEESRGYETYVDYTEGMQFDKGYLSPYFSNTAQFTVEYDDPFLLITDEPIISAQELSHILEAVRRMNKPLVIIARDVQGDALTALVINNSKGVIQAAAVRAPSFGDRQRAMTEDIAILTGGRVVGQSHGLEIKDLKPDDLGSCERIKITSRDTTIVNGKGDAEKINERIALLREQIEAADNEFIKEQATERLAKLSGGVAILHVGGPTEVELLEKKHRVEDALSATRAALDQGIVPGGGTSLLRVAEALKKVKVKGDRDFVAGYEIFCEALTYPIKKIAANAGISGDVVIDRVLKKKQFEYGWNAKTDEYGNMFKMGVIDPVKVTLSAIENAASVASMFLTTECAIIDVSAVSVRSNNDIESLMQGM